VEMDATLLSREPLEGAVHADALAGLLQSVAARGRTGTRPGGRLGKWSGSEMLLKDSFGF